MTQTVSSSVPESNEDDQIREPNVRDHTEQLFENLHEAKAQLKEYRNHIINYRMDITEM